MPTNPIPTPRQTAGSFFPGWAIPNSASTEKLWEYSGSGTRASVGGESGGDGGARAPNRTFAGTDTSLDLGNRENFGLGTVPGIGSLGVAAAAAGGNEPAVPTNVVDVIVVHGSDVVPQGYSKILRSAGGKRADLNTGAMGQYLYLAVKRETCGFRSQATGTEAGGGGGGAGRGRRSVGGAAVVALALIFPDRGETVPPLFQKVRRRGQPVDLNHGTNGERCFLCYKRGTTNPITDIQASPFVCFLCSEKLRVVGCGRWLSLVCVVLDVPSFFFCHPPSSFLHFVFLFSCFFFFLDQELLYFTDWVMQSKCFQRRCRMREICLRFLSFWRIFTKSIYANEMLNGNCPPKEQYQIISRFSLSYA